MDGIVIKGCCRTYRRDEDGAWRYPWGDPVPGAVDLTLADLVATELHGDDPTAPSRTRLVSTDEVERLTDQVALLQHTGHRGLDAGSLVVGMSAPELEPERMLTIDDIAELGSLSLATVQTCQYRGELPPPQSAIGRTSLWARPIIERWIQTRAGRGWRSHRYGPSAGRDRRTLR